MRIRSWYIVYNVFLCLIISYIYIYIYIIVFPYIYIALFWVRKALYIEGGILLVHQTTTNVQHPPGWCDGSHIATECPPNTAYWWRGDRVIKPISVWGLLEGRDGQRPMGEFGQDARVTPLLFFEGHPGIFNDHRESGPRFNVSPEGWCFLSV